ncbi:hypothetical protein [uncultured Helcococcus sp.]|uniref:hypothetical protein n=1 Tax=uncultured Helcococcus sp. TaxID=1072508 RepID=UPI002622EB01|nr:hypothetical protein [uncultured Helcococcus sp.]
MRNVFWWKLNPIEKLNRYKWALIILPILVIVLFWKFRFVPAIILSFIFVELAYIKYELLKLKADLYKKEII